ncbi:MAG: aldose 1-epimerase family protein [Candidatus Latescibacteria bacterium]|nr:aldose 1-epimerase family protein [Candidatus Latescibacterota bacterium]
MAEIFGSSMTKSELLERVGDIAQVCDARMMRFTDGRAEGVRAVEVTTGSGLSFTALPSRSLDISRALFNGMPLSWYSAVGETSPFFYQPDGLEWLRGFFGGLLTTCGISHSSHPCEDEGEQLGLHGRVANIPAEDVSISKTWDGDEYRIGISGRIREVSVYGHNLILTRTIETFLGAHSLTITDSIENAGFRESPVMMLYHINPGWPVLSGDSRIIAPVKSARGFDPLAESERDLWATFLPPQKDYEQRVYIHDMVPDDTGTVSLCLVNEQREIGVYLKYPKAEFPWFVEWKQLGRGEYVVGIEPGNITGGRAQMRKEGTLEFIRPGAVRRFSLEIGVLSGIGEIRAFEKNIGEVSAS